MSATMQCCRVIFQWQTLGADMTDSEVKKWVTNLDIRAKHLAIQCSVWFVMAQDQELIDWVKGEQNTFVFALMRQSLHKDIVSTIYTFLDDTKGVISLKKLVQKMKGRDQTIQMISKEIDALTVSAEFIRLEDVRNNQIGHAGSNLSESQVGDVRIVANQIVPICQKLKLIHLNGVTEINVDAEFVGCSDLLVGQVRKLFGMSASLEHV